MDESTLFVKIKAGAKQSRIMGFESLPQGRALKIHIKTLPIEGKANEALIIFLAQSLHMKKKDIALERGSTSSLKTLKVKLSADVLFQKLEDILKNQS